MLLTFYPAHLKGALLVCDPLFGLRNGSFSGRGRGGETISASIWMEICSKYSSQFAVVTPSDGSSKALGQQILHRYYETDYD